VRDLFTELKRRKVTRVAVVYAATAFVVVQAADIMLARLAVPDWAISFIVVLVILGFPVALVLAWALELTPDGVRVTTATAHPDPAEPAPSLVGKRTVLVAGALVILGFGLGAGWFLRPAGVGPEQVSATSSLGSVAVLPFDNFGAATEDYFSDGITEDIIAQLTRIPDLIVVSRTSAMRYRNTELSVREIGSQLSVGAVLEGSVRRAEGRVRIVAQLIDVATDTHLWAETYDREVQDIFAVQSEVAREIASALGRTLAPRGAPGGEEGDVAPTDPETYELYLRGRHLWHQRGAAPLRRAIEYFEEAIGRDPDFALAYAALGDAYLVLPFYDPSVSAPEGVELARAAAMKALSLDPGLGEAHATLGQASTISWDWERAEEHFARALEANPGYAAAHHWGGSSLMARRRHDEAVLHLRRAVELDPFSARLHRDLAAGLFFAGRDAEALQAIERGEELEPGFVDFYVTAWSVYLSVGRDDRALDALIRLQELAGGSALSPDELRSAFREEGPRGAVRLVLERAPETLGSSLDLARFQVYVGDTEGALRSLERTVNGRETYSAWITADPVIVEVLADDPRFQALARRIGVPLP
jgi:TolB-like protein/tetratricopeptide (TPR) repeat protein